MDSHLRGNDGRGKKVKSPSTCGIGLGRGPLKTNPKKS